MQTYLPGLLEARRKMLFLVSAVSNGNKLPVQLDPEPLLAPTGRRFRVATSSERLVNEFHARTAHYHGFQQTHCHAPVGAPVCLEDSAHSCWTSSTTVTTRT